MFYLNLGSKFQEGYAFIGYGWCRPNCDIKKSSCRLNAYKKQSSNYDECKSACNNEVDCTGFAISDSSYFYPNRCYMYGNLTSENKANWANPGKWRPSHHSTNDNEVHTSSGDWGARCFKSLAKQDQYKGKSSNTF